MGEKLTFVADKGGVEGFKTPEEAAAYAQRAGGVILQGKDAEEHQRAYDAEGLSGAATAVAANAGFGLPKLAVGLGGTDAQRAWVRASEEAHPWLAAGGGFLAPWGAAGKVAGGAARGLFGLGEAAEGASLIGKGASIFGEGSGLAEGAVARGAGELGAAERNIRGASGLFDEAASLAKPGFSREAEALAGRSMTPEAAAIVEHHPRSFLEAAVREGSLNAGVGALNSAGDYLLSERLMDGDPRQDAETLASAVLRGGLLGGALGGAAGLVTHGVGRAVDHVFNPANAPAMKVPAALRGELEEAYRRGGMSAEEAAVKARAAVEHGVAATSTDTATYNRFSASLENARIKRALERGEIELPPAMAGEADLAQFVESVAKKAHAVRGGAELPSVVDKVEGLAKDFEGAAAERRAAAVAAAREPVTPELAKVFAQNPYRGELSRAAAEAHALESPETAKLLEKAHALMERSPNSRVARIQALSLIDEASRVAPEGFLLDGERSLVAFPIEHEANGPKFLSALGEHQLADKARRDIGTLTESFRTGAPLPQDAVTALEEATKRLGLKPGQLDTALREHYENEAAKAIGAEAKKIDPTLKMLSGLFAGGIASKALGSFGLGYAGARAGELVAQAAADPIAASGTVRKAMGMLRYGAQDIERLAQGLAPEAAPRASLVNLAENVTPWGKVLWDTAPGKTARAVGMALENGFRELAPSMPQRAAHGMAIAQSIEAHLAAHEPKPMVPENVHPAALANLPPRYNDREVRDYQNRVTAAVNPRGVIASFFQTGVLPKEAAETLRLAHPGLVNQVVAQGAAILAKTPEADRYEMARKLDKLSGGVNGYFSPSSTPAFLSAVQRSYQQSAPQGPGPGGPTGNASPQKTPGPGGASFAPVTAMRGMDGKFLQATQAAPSAALASKLGR